MPALVLALIMIGLIGDIARAEPPAATELVKTELVSNVANVSPGRPFAVGVIFHIEPGWHIYWTNPGDSGMPTTVELKGPDGYQIGALQYPTPVKFTQPGDIVGYGYEDQVVILAMVTPPPGKGPEESIEFSADVKFLVCEKVCIPGDAKLNQTFPTRSTFHTRTLDNWIKQVAVEPASAGASVRQSFDWDSRKLTISIDWNGDAPEQADWFPPPAPDINFSDIQVTRPTVNQTVITVMVSPLARKALEKKIFDSVLGYHLAGGARRGIRVRFVPGPSDGLEIKQD